MEMARSRHRSRLPHRQPKPARQTLGGLAPHQSQHHLPLARQAPPLARRQWRHWLIIVSCGQRGRAPLALAAHSPNSHIHPCNLFIHHAAPRGSSFDNGHRNRVQLSFCSSQKWSASPVSSLPAASPFGCRPSRMTSTMSGARSVRRSRRLTKLRVTPSASASSPADRHPTLPAIASTDAPGPARGSASRRAAALPVPTRRFRRRRWSFCGRRGA
jgi:hypothetical protein